MLEHVIERALERYGVVLSEAEARALEAQLCRATCLRRLPDKEVHVVRHQGIAMLAGARPWMTPRGERFQLCTILPADEFDATRRKANRHARHQGKYRLKGFDDRMSERDRRAKYGW